VARTGRIVRRVLRIIGKLVVAVIVLAVLAFGFIHTPWGKSVIRGVVEDKLAAKVTGKVSVGWVDYSALFRSIELHDITIAGNDGKPAIAIGSLTADLDRGSLVHGAPVIDELVLDGVSATIVQRPDGTTNLTGLARPSDAPPPASIEVAALTVRGAVHVTRVDGTTIDVADLAIRGRVAAKPRINELDVALGKLTAVATVARPGTAPKQLALSIGATTLARRGGVIDLALDELSADALAIGSVAGHVSLVAGALAGEQSLALRHVRVDHDKLAKLVGKQLLSDDVDLDLTVTGPPDKLVVHGGVQARRTTLTIDGTADVHDRAHLAYDVSLVGKGESVDLAAAAKSTAPPVQTAITMHVVGTGITRADADAVVTLGVGPTRIGSIPVGELTATAHAQHGTIALDKLDVTGLGFTIHGSGSIEADAHLRGRVAVAGRPVEALRVLREAGVAVPIKVPPIPHLEIGLSADGYLDGKLALTIVPAKLTLAGGSVAIDGSAQLDHRKLETATTTIAVTGVDIDGLATLAGKPRPKVHGSIGGKLVLTRTLAGQTGRGSLTIALREPALTIVARTSADMTTASLTADLLHAGAKLGTISATLAHDMTGILPGSPWHIVVDVPRHTLAELAQLAPRKLEVPDGDARLHADISGTPRAPKGTIDATVNAAGDDPFGAKHADLHAELASSAKGMTVAVTSAVTAEALAGPIAKLAAQIQLPPPYLGNTPQLTKLAAGATIDAKLDLPERELASIPKAPSDLGGSVGGSITARGTPKALVLAGSLAWTGYPTAAGDTGTTKLDVAGTPTALDIHVTRDGIAIAGTLVRDGARTTVTSKITANEVPVARLLPAKLAHYLDAVEPGSVDWNMDATLSLVRGPDGVVIDPPKLDGTLAIRHGAFALPHTDRRWHDIALEVAGDPAGIRLTKLELHESDKFDPNRAVTAHGLVTLDHLKARAAELDVEVRHWLMLGKTSPVFGDAPTATVDLDAHVAADLTQPTIGVDATITNLAFLNPDRQERGHQPEISEVSSDVIYVSGDQPVGKLPVTPPPSPPKPRRPVDIHVHVPKPIHAVRVPFDVQAVGDVDITLRDDGMAIRGKLDMTSGTLFLFGRYHDIVAGSFAFTDEHPKGWFHVVADRELPAEAVRGSTRTRERLTLSGSPTAPQVALDGVAGATIPGVLSTYNAGHPIYATRPGLPATSTVEVPRGDQMMILGFVSLALPHLLFLDSIEAWADPSEPRGAYGRIRNLEAERYVRHRSERIRVVGRPTQPGRSTAELQLDHLWLDDARACFGAGVRAGDRLGGGVGVFFEWSSAR